MLKSVITNTPYRISLGGGGTDLPFYYLKRGGSLVFATIDQYISIFTSKRIIDDKIFLQYSQTEWSEKTSELKHPQIKAVLEYFKIKDGFQVATFSSMPNYTGLGASSSLIVGLIKSIISMKGESIDPNRLAEKAFHIEREILGSAGGHQDQYAASLGGIQSMKISEKGKIYCQPIDIPAESLELLQGGLILVFTNVNRKSEDIIKAQIDNDDTITLYDKIKDIGEKSIKYLKSGDVASLGELMDQHWTYKREITKQMTNSFLDEMYLKLKDAGSTGGKVIGAGGGGFFLMAVPHDKKKFMESLKKLNFRYIPFKFDFRGSHVVHEQRD